MNKHLAWLVVWVLMCGHFSAWAGINEDLLKAIETGKNEEVERLLDAHAEVSAQNAAGSTPLHLASAAGNLKAVELLIAHHANVNTSTRSGFTPLHFATYFKHKEVALFLLEHGAEVNATSEYGYTPLFKAVEPLDAASAPDGGGISSTISPEAARANKELVALLLAKGASVKVKTKDGSMPLHFAAMLGVPDIVELLLASGAELNAKGTDGVTPLFLAARYDRKEVAATLLAHGANMDLSSDKGKTPLCVAVSNGNSATVELLLRQGASANPLDKQCGPLLLQLLLTEMENYNINNFSKAYRYTSDERSAFNKKRKMVKGEWQTVARLLVEYGADVNVADGGGTPLYIAATMGDRELVELLLNKGAHVNGDISGATIETPLHSAIAERHQEVAELLVKHGANVNASNMSKRTPLHFLATYVKDGKLAELMIGKGADVTAQDKNGETPYDFAIRSGNQEVAAVLQQHGAKASGIAPPLPAALTMDTLNKLLESGMAPDQQLPDGSTLLHAVVTEGNKVLVEKLLGRGGDINVKDKNGATPLMASFIAPMMQSPLGAALARQMAATKEQIEAMQKMQGQWREIALLLISKGAEVNVKSPGNGMTPLHYAATVDYRDVAEALLSKGASVNDKAADSTTSLHLAVSAGHADMVKMLIAKGADIHALGMAGATPLHLAVASRQDENGRLLGSKQIAELLISHGANVNVKDESGVTPLHLAALTGDIEMVKLLIAHWAEVNALDKQSHTPLFYATMQGNTDVANILIKQGGTK